MSHRWIFLCLLCSSLLYAQNQAGERGYRRFESTCALCHGSDGTGGEFGPNISVRLPKLNDEQLTTVIHGGLPKKGMPAFPNIEGKELDELIAFLRSLKPREAPEVKRKVTTDTGKILEGEVLNESNDDLELQTPDKSIYLLRRAGGAFREVTSETDWPNYNGGLRGNRLTKLVQIDKANVSRLAPKWIFTMPGVSYLETTPIVIHGIMYVTSGNICYALDAGNGRTLWHFERPKNKGLLGGVGINRGAAVAGDGLFMVTGDAHLLRLNRLTGAVEWDTEMADWRENYFATSAPLVVGNLVISGPAGGESGARGFLAAYDQSTGKEVWRFWTVPAPGEPEAETWKGADLKHGGAVAWFTGSYDPELETLYWQSGNPGPDYNGKERLGDNLYSDCLLALDPKTGKLKWHYQFTPHDLHDWDATEPVIVQDAEWQGKRRKLLFTANRNGFFYVLDRTNGQLLLAKPFVKKMNWAKEIGPDGRPVLKTLEKAGNGTKVCPSQDGATNWYSSSYLPSTGLFYLQALEKCDIYSESPAEWKQGQDYLGGGQRPVPGEIPQKVLRAIDPQTGKIVWELPQTGRAETWGGTLATESGLVFFGEDSGRLQAVDAATGKPLWNFEANQFWKASPMAYQFDGREYIAVASGDTVTAFALQN
ncbi:MAG TPA: PQQ-binding-like beta-propeller repeat protein [Bryobacteraceae bacterium]|jgi:alcohol dehydrogenase (cytochrome c)|nr:PQQ-binding-like beta-propeller repeat protein [Bryobacteraceae bacterium]